MTDYAAELAAEPVTDLDLDTIEAQACAEIAGAPAKWLAELRNRDRLRLCREVRELREQRRALARVALAYEPCSVNFGMDPDTVRAWAEGGDK